MISLKYSPFTIKPYIIMSFNEDILLFRLIQYKIDSLNMMVMNPL